ncbi:MAG: hypothetical protein M3R69_10425, partial [Acidobacteriota bacterium]|nr:hypothetical protein [Acidobacteriota bacterium]
MKQSKDNTDVNVSDAALNHLRIVLMHVPADVGFIEIRAIKKTGRVESFWLPAGENGESVLTDAVEWARKHNDAGYDIYLGYCPRKEAGIGTKAGVPLMTAAYLDLDLDKFGVSRESAFEAIEDSPIKPNLVVDSGHGLHLIFFHEPTADKLAWSILQKQLASRFKSVGADDGFAGHEAAILRLTPFLNQKDGTPTRILEFRSDELIQAFDDLVAAFGAKERRKKDQKADTHLIATKGIKRISKVIDRNRNVTLTKEAGRLRKFGWEYDEINA